MSAPRPAASPRCCSNAARGASMRSMSGAASCTRDCAADPDVVSLEETDIRALDPARLAEPPDFAAIDVSFISLKLVLPALDRAAAPARAARRADQAAVRGRQEAPQEGHRARSRGPGRGVRRHRGVRSSLGWDVVGIIPSPIDGGDGNTEFLLAARDALIHQRGEWTRHEIVTSLSFAPDYGARHDHAGNDASRGRRARG